MRLAYIVPFFPYLYTPWLFREMAWMRDRGHSVVVISLGDPPGPRAVLEDFGLDDVPVLQVRVMRQSYLSLAKDAFRLLPSRWLARGGESLVAKQRESGFCQGLHEWMRLKQIVGFLREHRIDVMDAHWAAHSASMALQAKQATGVPFAVRIHGGDVYRSPSPQLPAIVREADAVCCVSRFVRDLLQGERLLEALPIVPRVSLDVGKVHICPNGVPSHVVASEPAPQCANEQTIVTIGRIDPEKRHVDLIEAVAALSPRFPGLRLKIVGGGILEPQLRQRAEQLALADRVEITGALPWSEVIRARDHGHIYVHASIVEGCSLSILEGMAAGVPMLISRVGAAEECVREGANGFTFDAGDTRALTTLLGRLLETSPSRRREMGAVSLQMIREKFELGTTMSQVEAVLMGIRSRPIAVG